MNDILEVYYAYLKEVHQQPTAAAILTYLHFTSENPAEAGIMPMTHEQMADYNPTGPTYIYQGPEKTTVPPEGSPQEVV